MPGKQARVLCPVCQEPIPPDETECENCGAFVIDEAVVRLGRAFGLKREAALKLVEMGFRHPRQFRDRDPGSILQKGEAGLLFICTNCGGFVASGDTTCPRCASEFETEPEEPVPEEQDILDLVLCPVCGADNDVEAAECEICGERLREPVSPPEPVPSKVETAPRQVVERPVPVPSATPAPSVGPRVVSERTAPVGESPPSKPVSPIPRPPTVPRPEPAKPDPRAAGPEVSESRTLPEPSSGRAAPRVGPETTAEPRPLVQKRVRSDGGLRLREVPQRIATRSGVAPEIVGSIVVASGAGLLLSGFLGQVEVIAGIAAFLAGLLAYVIPMFLRSGVNVGTRDASVLAVAAGLGLGVPVLYIAGVDPTAAGTLLALGSTIPFTWSARRLLASRGKVALALASAVPLIGLAVVGAHDPPLALTVPWGVSVLVTLPWPAALAGVEVRRRRSTAALRQQLVKAEHDIVREHYDRSLEEYDRAIAASRRDVPGAEIPWYGKGATLILLGRYEEALRAIDTALDINPRNEVAWVNKGNAFSKMGRHVDALRCLNAAIKVNPRYEVAWNNKGNTLARLGKYEEALQCYERAIGIDPEYRGAWVNKGFVLTKLGRLEEAASCADRALRLTQGRQAGPA